MRQMENQDIKEVTMIGGVVNISKVMRKLLQEVGVVRFTMEFPVYRMMDQ